MAKKNKETKLNSMRLLEQRDIPYEVLTYDDSIKDAESVAELIGVPEFMVYKTLIAQSVATAEPTIVMIASDRQLNLKKLASAANEKKMRMASQTDAEQITGLQVGGISALMLMDKNWTVYIDSAATELQNIVISAGQRGLQIRLPVTALMTITGARLADLSEPKSG